MYVPIWSVCLSHCLFCPVLSACLYSSSLCLCLSICAGLSILLCAPSKKFERMCKLGRRRPSEWHFCLCCRCCWWSWWAAAAFPFFPWPLWPLASATPLRWQPNRAYVCVCAYLSIFILFISLSLPFLPNLAGTSQGLTAEPKQSKRRNKNKTRNQNEKRYGQLKQVQSLGQGSNSFCRADGWVPRKFERKSPKCKLNCIVKGVDVRIQWVQIKVLLELRAPLAVAKTIL